MKCKYCDGTGTSNWCVNGCFKPCDYCDGTGEVEDKCDGKGVVEPLTNEEWFCQLPTSEKAKVLSNATYSSVFNSDILFLGKEAEQKKWELWLKEMHE